MPFSAKSLEEKPYNVCLNCVNIGVHCDGANFLAMDMDRLSEWCRLRKNYLHDQDPKWTNEYIAEQAGMSKVSVDRFLSGKMKDTKFSTAASILKVLVNGSWGQYPCALAEMAENGSYAENPETIKRAEDAEAECKRLRDIIASKSDEHNAELATKNEEYKGRIEFLREQVRTKDKLLDERADFLRIKDRYIKILTTLFLVSIGIIITSIVADILNPDLGFIFLR